jgi:hypothetical protein
MNTKSITLTNGDTFAHIDAITFQPIDKGYLITPNGQAFEHFNDAQQYYADMPYGADAHIVAFDEQSLHNYVIYENRYLYLNAVYSTEIKFASEVTNKIYDLYCQGLAIRQSWSDDMADDEQEVFDNWCNKVWSTIVATDDEEILWLRMSAQEILIYNLETLTKLLAPNVHDILEFNEWLESDNVVYIAEEQYYTTHEAQYNDRKTLKEVFIYFIISFVIAQ